VGGTATLTFTLTNPNPGTAVTGVGFTDPLPAGLTVPDGASATCGGVLTESGNTIVLVGASIAPGETCSFSVTVTATSGGVKHNVTSAVSLTEGGTGGSASAFLVVVAPPAVAPPTIAKSFVATSISVNGTTTLAFTLTNPNTGSALTSVGFSDTLPAGLVVATPNGLTGACGGTVTAAAGGGSMALANGGLAANGSCAVTVNVTAVTAGLKSNTTSPVTSTEGGTGRERFGVPRVAAPPAVEPPTIAKALRTGVILLGETTSLTSHPDEPEWGPR
jgi:uncharacterized repeat protein (TIGR01451 family)